MISQLKLRDKKQLAKLERVGSVSERRNRRRIQRQKNLAPSRNHEGLAWLLPEHSLGRGKGMQIERGPRSVLDFSSSLAGGRVSQGQKEAS